MRLFRDYSIATKLTWMNMLAGATALSLACAAFVAYDLITFRENLVSNLSIQAQIVGSNSVSALLFNDPDSAKKTLSALQAAPHIENATIFTPGGQAFAAYWRDHRRTTVSVPSAPAAQTEIHWFKDRHLTVVHAIIFQGKLVGQVCIQSDLQEWTERLQRYVIIVVAVLLVSLLTALLTSSVIRRAIAEPILSLAETARIVSREKNYSVRARLTQNHDELAGLIATFNDMLSQIQTQDTALRFEIEERTRIGDALKNSLATSERELKELADQKFALDQHAIVATTDVQGTITYVNDKFCNISKYSRGELLGQNHRILNSSHHPKEFFQQMYHTIAKGRIWRGEICNRAKGGSIYWVDTTIVPFLEANGKPRQYMAIRADITERKRAEEARGWLAALVESSDDAIISKTLEGKITAWNRGAEKVFGYSSHEAVGQPMLMIVPPERVHEESDILAHMRRGESVEHFETVRVRKNGNKIDVSASISPIRDTRGAIVGASTIAHDITKQKQAEQEIRRLNEELEQRVLQRTVQLETANKELEAFSYSVSHDLRAPLRHISGFSRILIEDFGTGLDPQARQYLERIQDGTQRMGRLVDELLNLARVGRHELRRQITGLKSIVQEVMFMLQPENEGRKVDWMVADLPVVDCDPVLVKQVFQNLITNALKFTRPRKKALIEIGHHQKENGESVLMVRDNGVGFNMNYQDKLFGVFQRLHRAEDFEGTGIGLATVRRIIHKHGGRVWAEAEVDKGATFYFTLAGAELVSVKSISVEPVSLKSVSVKSVKNASKTTVAGAQL